MQEKVANIGTGQFIKKLEGKIKDINPSDFRFYNIGRIPLLAKHTLAHSTNCDSCKANLEGIEMLVDSLPECLNIPDDRKKFDNLKNSISSHLEKEHRIRYANYHYSLYTFIGMAIGGAIGYIMHFYQHGLWPVFAIAGAFIGSIYGKKRELKKNREHKLM